MAMDQQVTELRVTDLGLVSGELNLRQVPWETGRDPGAADRCQ